MGLLRGSLYFRVLYGGGVVVVEEVMCLFHYHPALLTSSLSLPRDFNPADLVPTFRWKETKEQE